MGGIRLTTAITVPMTKISANADWSGNNNDAGQFVTITLYPGSKASAEHIANFINGLKNGDALLLSKKVCHTEVFTIGIGDDK